jgi:hypothetical protein
MGARRQRRARRGRWPLLALLAVAVTGTAVLLGLRSDPTAERPVEPAPKPAPTALRNVDLSGLPIPRAPFCDKVDDKFLVAALGGAVTHTEHYGSGSRAQLAPGVRDIAHEYNCTWVGAAGASARAWVFAEPVQPAEARTLARDQARVRGCEPATGGPTFGSPSVTVACRAGDGRTTVTLSGLFGDAWFSCQLTRTDAGATAQALRRTARWCVHVAATLGARP